MKIKRDATGHIFTDCMMQWFKEEFPDSDPMCIYETIREHMTKYSDGICLWGYLIFEISEDEISGSVHVSWPVDQLQTLNVKATDPYLFPKLKEYIIYYKKQYVDHVV